MSVEPDIQPEVFAMIGKHLGLYVRLYRHGCGNDCHIVQKSFGEQRSNRSVNQSRRQNRFVARTSFALFEASGDFAHRIHFLLEIYSQREKIDSVARLGGKRRVYHNARFSASDKARTVCLLGILADFNGHRASADFRLKDVILSFSDFANLFFVITHF